MDEVFTIGVLWLFFSKLLKRTSSSKLELSKMAYFSYFIKDRRNMTRLNMAVWKTFLEAFFNVQDGSQFSRVSL